MNVAIVGSGNWGSCIAKIAGSNCLKHKDVFGEKVKMWVYEEVIDGKKLTEIINEKHENIKYLPGVQLPENVIAVPDVVEAVKDAHILLFVLPHQFLVSVLRQIKDHVRKDAIGCSLIKGLSIGEHGPILLSDLISKELHGMDVSVCMGANLANEVAAENFCEATIGYKKLENGKLLKTLLSTDYFRITIVKEVPGIEVCGALKNVVALGAGLCEGLGYGQNTKATFIRLGMVELRNFNKLFYEVNDEIYFESCGVADVIVTCYGGRNRKVGMEFGRTGKALDELEAELLHGQKAVGISTCKETYEILKKKGVTDQFPCFTSLYKVLFEGVDRKKFVDMVKDGYARLEKK